MRPLRQPRAGNQHATPDKPTATKPPSSPSMIFRRLPASSSFVLAAARLRALQLDPGRAGGRTWQLRGRIQKNSQPSPAARLVTGPDPYALLTVVALMGADERELSARILMRCPACFQRSRRSPIQPSRWTNGAARVRSSAMATGCSAPTSSATAAPGTPELPGHDRAQICDRHGRKSPYCI